MYKLVTAVLKEKNSSKPWSEVDISLTTVSQFFSKFISGYIVLTNDQLAGEHIVDYRTFITGPYPTPIADINFNQWLALIGNRVLPTIKEPEFTTGEVYFSNALKAGWEITKAHPISPNTDSYPIADLTDGLLTKRDVSMVNYPDSFLVSVNGLMHYSYRYENSIKVKDLTKSFYKSKKCEVGIFSFTEVGSVKQIPITPENLLSVNSTDAYKREFCVKTEMDLKDKTVWASIGGYLIRDIKSVSVNNFEDGNVYINLTDSDLVKRLAHQSTLMDVDDLGIMIPDYSPTSFNLDDFNTRLVMQRYLTMSQSFIIVIDTPNIQEEKIDIHFTGVVGVYTHHERIGMTIFNQYGLVQEYQPSKIDEGMGILTPPDLMKYNVLNTAYNKDTKIFDSNDRLRYSDRWPSLTGVRFKSMKKIDA